MSEDVTVTVTPMRERVAEELRALLARRRMSATELARRTGTKQAYLSRRMTGEIAFDLDDLERIADVLGVKVAKLFPPGDIETYPRPPMSPQTEPTVRPMGNLPRQRSIRPPDRRPAGHAGSPARPDGSKRTALLG